MSTKPNSPHWDGIPEVGSTHFVNNNRIFENRTWKLEVVDVEHIENEDGSDEIEITCEFEDGNRKTYREYKYVVE